MPTPDSIYGALTPDIAAGAGALPPSPLIQAMERIAASRRAQMGVDVPPTPSAPAPAAPGPQSSIAPPVTLASAGQTYRNYPAATFDQRFGPYSTGPVTDQDLLRRFLERPRDPEVITPGSPSWPAGFTRI